MDVKVNEEWKIIPSSLSEFTLGQKIEYQSLYGDDIEARRLKLEEIQDEDYKELQLAELNIEAMYKSIAFFLGTTVEAIKETRFVDEIVSMYLSSMAICHIEEQDIEKNVRVEFTWKKEIWEIQTPELVHGSKMTFGEFVDSKQIIQQMMELGKNRWEMMLPICAVYLRKKDEPYQESFLYDNSDRLKLMQELPMDIALQVGFFLKDSLNMYKSFSQSSSLPVSSPIIKTSKST